MILLGHMDFCFHLLFSYPWALTLPIHNKYDDPINLKMQTYPSCLTNHSYIFTCLFHCCSVTKSCPSVTPWTAACQLSLSFIISLSLLKLLGCKEIQLVRPKGNQSWIFIGRTDAEVETQILWPPHVKNWLMWKDPDAGKDWGQEEKGTTEDEMLDGITNSMDMVWVDSRSWWWTGRPGMLQFIGLQRVGHDWACELNWAECFKSMCQLSIYRLFITNAPWRVPAPSWSGEVILLCREHIRTCQ